MPYGYLGQNQPNQTVSNSGVFSITDVAELQSQGKLGGSLELIEEKNLTGTTPSAIDFINLKENVYNVHFLTYNNLQITGGADTIRARVSNDGGSTFESTSNYDSAIQTMTTGGTFSEVTRTNYDAFDRIGQNAVNQSYNGYIYIYNAGNSSKYTFLTHHNTNQNDGFRFGGQVYKVAETVNAFRLFLTTYTFKDVGSVLKLYGVKQL